MAVAYMQQGRLGEAEGLLRALLQIDPNHFWGLNYLGVICNQQSRFQEAVTLLRRAVVQDPGSAEAWGNLGNALTALGSEEAIAQYEKALGLDPRYVEAHNNFGNALLAFKRPEQAIAHFEQALAIRPNAAEVYNNLGNALAALARHVDAIACYRKAIALRPNFPEAFHNTGVALEALRRHEEAIPNYEKAVALRPDYWEAHCHLGNALLVLHRFDKAIAQFDRALGINPGAAEVQANIGSALAMMNRHAEAIAHFQKALAIRPDFAELHNNLGNSLAALDRHEEAVVHYRKALELQPSLAEAQGNLGNALEALNRPQEAIASYMGALAANPRLPDVHHNLGNLLRSLGRLDESRLAFEEAIRLQPKKPDFYRGLAESKKFAADDPYLAAMEEMAHDMGAFAKKEQAELHFALAKAYADLDRHELSFRHLLDGNAVRREYVSYDEPATLDLFRRIEASFSREIMERRRGAGDPSDVPVFIVGMPRSGTTLIEQLLASHPSVFGAGELLNLTKLAARLRASEGSPVPFPEAISALADDHLRQLGAAYVRGVRAAAPAARRITDKLPSNFRFAGLINLALPNARIIHTRRDPVDTCLSCFSKMFAGEHSFACDLGELGRYYRAYEALMEHWRRVLPDGVMLEVQYEDLVADFAPQARRVVEHCGLEWDERCLAFHETERAVRTASATQVRQPVYQSAVGRSRPYAAMLGPLLDALGKPRANGGAA